MQEVPARPPAVLPTAHCSLIINRNVGYDGEDSVGTYLNRADVKRALGAPEEMTWVSCSPEVDKYLAGDVMKVRGRHEGARGWRSERSHVLSEGSRA